MNKEGIAVLVVLGLLVTVTIILIVRKWNVSKQIRRQFQRADTIWREPVRSSVSSEETIFVALCFAKANCQDAVETVLLLLDKAIGTHRLFFGITISESCASGSALQHSGKQDFWSVYHSVQREKYFYWPHDFRDHIRLCTVHGQCCYAEQRCILERDAFRGEKYMLSLQNTNVQVTLNWDTLLIEKFRSVLLRDNSKHPILFLSNTVQPNVGNENTRNDVLTVGELIYKAEKKRRFDPKSTYAQFCQRLLSVTPISTCSSDVLAFSRFMGTVPQLRSISIARHSGPYSSVRSLFWTSTVPSFTLGRIVQEVPYCQTGSNEDTNDYFMSIRYWTHGCDFWYSTIADDPIIAITKRVQHVGTAIDTSSIPAVLAQNGHCTEWSSWFGSARTVAEYRKYSGVDPFTKTVQRRAYLGLPPLDCITNEELIQRFNSLEAFKRMYSARGQL